MYKHFILYGHYLDGTHYYFIVLAYGDFLAWTNFHRFVHQRGLRIVTSGHMERLRYVVKFLNYAFFTKNHIQKLNQINDAIVRSFLIEEIRKPIKRVRQQ